VSIRPSGPFDQVSIRPSGIRSSVPNSKITNSSALEYVKGLINFFEQQSDDFTKEISNINASKCKLTRKMECEMKQTSILDYFSKNNNK
jgi:hypothetical protein